LKNLIQKTILFLSLSATMPLFAQNTTLMAAVDTAQTAIVATEAAVVSPKTVIRKAKTAVGTTETTVGTAKAPIVTAKSVVDTAKTAIIAAKTAVDTVPTAIGVAKTTVDTSSQDPLPFTGSMPLMTFDKKTVNFGNIKTGERPEVVFNFTNTGNKELDIEIVSACECTTLEWTKTTVKPGEKGFIKAVFRTDETEWADHKRFLKKAIDIILKQTHPSNDYPLVDTVTFEAFIID
jgi:Protein of unknown function (DUF1573)